MKRKIWTAFSHLLCKYFSFITDNHNGIAETAERIIREMFEINTARSLNELYISDVIYALKAEIRSAKSVRITEPANDLILEANKIMVVGNVEIAVERM